MHIVIATRDLLATGGLSIKQPKANAICLSIAETIKANGVNFYRYLLKLLTDLPNLDIYQHPEILNQYMPWSKIIQAECGNKMKYPYI